jgi:nitrogen regulatory protein PII
MTHEGLTKMTKVEVVVAGAEAAAVRQLFEATGATGFTSLSGVSGLGHHGFHQGRLLFNEQAALELLITVVPDDRVRGLLAGLRPLLAETAGVMFVSETFVSRPEYFT